MEIAASDIEARAAYRLLTGCVVPRPIAWITTLSASGLVNLAPFSCYTIACTDPPMLAITFGTRDLALKDTSRNILESKEFVVNIVGVNLVGEVHASSAECGPQISEVAALGLQTLPSVKVRPPRIALAPVHLECRYEQSIELGARKDLVIFGEVLRFHIRDDLYRDGKIDTDLLSPLARLGGPNYASLGAMITMPPATLAGPV